MITATRPMICPSMLCSFVCGEEGVAVSRNRRRRKVRNSEGKSSVPAGGRTPAKIVRKVVRRRQSPCCAVSRNVTALVGFVDFHGLIGSQIGKANRGARRRRGVTGGNGEVCSGALHGVGIPIAVGTRHRQPARREQCG